ncbi:MAG: transcriptional regulator, partial [Armatimonadetes bacterium]|nr:transcriptional regulator [Armatimonadota bacterium]
ERQWQAVRPQRCPLWNVIYGALTGNPCDIDRAVETLAELPLDLVDWRMVNSHRSDITIDDRPGRFGELQSTEIVPYDERADFRWNHNPYRLESGGEGRTEYDGAHFLLPYWMARYHGLLAQ